MEIPKRNADGINDAAESIQIGNQRLKMMKTYEIIK